MPTEPPDELTVESPKDTVVVAPRAAAATNQISNHVPSQVTATATATVPIAPQTTATIPVPTTVPPTTMHSNVPTSSAAGLTNKADLSDGWVPLERWSEVNGFGALQRAAADEFPSFAFVTSKGTMWVKIGSQLAYWNGLEYRLGFAPELIGGHPYVHALDVRKNFVPLLAEPIRFKPGTVLVIDPGHGGTDVGASSIYDGHYEKEYTLDCARRLEALLAGHGWTVWLTRTNDVNVPLSSRVSFAEEHRADLFLSLHFNSASPDRQQAGLETYCLTPAGMPSSLTRGYRDDLTLVYPNNRFDTENLQYAVEVHRAALKVNGNEDRGVRRARFLGVLQGQNRPAILVEGGYLSNPQEARQIADPAYRQHYVEALAQALLGDTNAAKTNLITETTVARPAAASPDGKIN
jgi:N-acetylmuramoyl-L-alanine amidase